MGPDGLPADRTICPECRNEWRQIGPDVVQLRDECATCDFTGVVCPTCRGNHWLSLGRPAGDAGPNHNGTACPGCMRPKLDDSGRHVYDADLRRHRFERDAEREQATIARYRAGRRAA